MLPRARLSHVKALTARLRRGVVMFHSDLIYLRENVKALKEILKIESGSRRRTVRRAKR